MNDSPKGGGGLNPIVMAGLAGLVLVAVVIFGTMSMLSSGGGGRSLLSVAQGGGSAQKPAPTRPQPPANTPHIVAAAIASPTPSPSPLPSPTGSPGSPSPKASKSPGPAKSEAAKASPKPKPAPSATAIANRPASGRPVLVASLPRPGNPAAQPLGPAITPTPEPLEPPPTPPPTPAPTAAPKLEDARLLNAVSPELQEFMRGETTFPISAAVEVTVGPNGRATTVRLERSSGNSFADRAALAAAKSSIYTPAKIDGRPTSGTYRAVYEFR